MAQTYVALESKVGKRFGKSESESESKAFNNLLQCFPNRSNGFVTYTPSYPENQTNPEHDSATTQSPSSPSSRMGAQLSQTCPNKHRPETPHLPMVSMEFQESTLLLQVHSQTRLRRANPFVPSTACLDPVPSSVSNPSSKS